MLGYAGAPKLHMPLHGLHKAATARISLSFKATATRALCVLNVTSSKHSWILFIAKKMNVKDTDEAAEMYLFQMEAYHLIRQLV